MSAEPTAYAFGPFRLLVARRELLAHGVPVVLGQRAFDVLLALVRRRGELASKDEIMTEVWPGVIVEENNLQVHVSTLRKVLGTGDDGQRYLVTVPGRGYRFVAPIAEGSGSTGEAPREAPPTATRSTLPAQPTALIGRDDDLAALASALPRHRLITLTGAGGVGKTRLAIEAGHRNAPLFSDGVRFCELAALTEDAQVAAAVAEALGMSLADGSLQALAQASAGQRMLLVLDNCEHVIGGAAHAAETLIRSNPELTILATSRERLAIAGESVLAVPPLALPDARGTLSAIEALRSPAVRLFEERASALGQSFMLTDAEADTVAAICRALDGIPLAIEMAAPRLKMMSLQQLAGGLDTRFRLLKTGSRTALPRHQTLYALIDWSYELLAPAERTLLMRLAVLAGAATIEAIASVAAGGALAEDEVVDVLSSLVEKSLVVAETAGAAPRYRMLESTRHFALEKLAETGEAEAIARRHAVYAARRVTAAADRWETSATADWLAAYADDIDTVRAAIAWAFGPNGDLALALDLTGHSHELWAELGLTLEHRRWVTEALTRVTPETPGPVVARLLSWQAGDVRDLDDPTDHADALRAAALHEAAGDRFNQGKMLLRAGTGALDPDAPGAAEELLQRAHALLAPFGRSKSLARCLSVRASARLFAGDPAAAGELHQQALAISRSLGEPA